jgi:Leucine-rich repeat (LRR) protein
MASLSRVDVTRNDIEMLPPELGEIESLKKIDLSLNPVIVRNACGSHRNNVQTDMPI